MLDLFSKISPPPPSRPFHKFRTWPFILFLFALSSEFPLRVRLAEQEMWTGRNVGRVRIHSNCLTSPRVHYVQVCAIHVSRISRYIYIYVWQGVGQSRIGPATSILTNLPIVKIKQAILRLGYVRVYSLETFLFVDNLADTLHSGRRVMIRILSYVQICTAYSCTLQLS